MTLLETLETPSVVVQEEKYVDKQHCFLEAVRKHSSEINRLTYRLDKCIEEYEKYTNSRNSSSSNDDSLQSRKVHLLVQRMGRLRSSGLMLCHEISKCVDNNVKANIQNGKQKPKKTINNTIDVKESSCRNKSNSDYDGNNWISAQTEYSRAHAKAILQDVWKYRNYEMYNESQVVEKEAKRNADLQTKDDKNNKLNLYYNNKSESKVCSDKKENKENHKLVELYQNLQSCVDKSSIILTTFMESVIAPRASQQQLQMSSSHTNCEKHEKVKFVQDYCPLSLIGLTATLLEPWYVMCDKENNSISRYADSFENIKTSKNINDTNAMERNAKDDAPNIHEQYEELECSNQEVEITHLHKITHDKEEEQILEEAPFDVNVVKADETNTRPALQTLPLEVELSSPRIIQVNNTNIIHMSTNVMKPTCYCEDHVIHNNKEINRKYADSEEGNNYKSKQNAHSIDDTNDKRLKESLVHQLLSTVTAEEAATAQKQQESAKCEYTESYDHTDTHLPSFSSCAFTNNTKANKSIEHKHIAQSNETSKSRNTVNAFQRQQQNQLESQEKQVEDVILSDIQHAIHSMKSSAIKVSEIIQHEQPHFTINAELLTKQVHSTEGNIQQINKLSTIRQSHSGSCMLWLEKLPAGKSLMHSFLLPLWNVVKQIVYFTVILVCTLLTLFLMTIFHKPHSYRLHHTANSTAVNSWSTFDANKLINNVSNEYSSSSNNTSNAYRINTMQKNDNIVSNYTTTSNLHL